MKGKQIILWEIITIQIINQSNVLRKVQVIKFKNKGWSTCTAVHVSAEFGKKLKMFI